MVPIDSDIDYVLLGSDGIFDYLDNSQVSKIVRAGCREVVTEVHKAGSFEHTAMCCGQAVNAVMRSAMRMESTDNLSCVVLALKNFHSLASTDQQPDHPSFRDPFESKQILC